MSTLNSRLKAWRDAQRLSQAAAAATFGVPTSTYIKYEVGTRVPGASAMEAFVTAGGINANWLLTGEGPMLLGDLQAAGWSGALDRERMRISLKAIEMGLKATERVMAPAAKAELLLAVYDLLEDSSVTEEKVMNIVKLAA
jgi:transcriptional regulator with XRE-family HTH domain